MLSSGAGWVLLGFVGLGLLWAVRRGKKGYAMVMGLEARLEAHASADARAAALASNAVHVNLDGSGAGGHHDHHDGRGIDYDALAAALVRHGIAGPTYGHALGTGLRPDLGGVLARDAVRAESDSVTWRSDTGPFCPDPIGPACHEPMCKSITDDGGHGWLCGGCLRVWEGAPW